MSPLASYVAETVVTLLAVIALAVLVLYGARRVGVGRPAGPVRLVGRLPLDGRRAVYLVRVSDKVYVLGASEAGLSKLGELSADGLCLSEERTPRSFSSVLSGLLDRRQSEKVARGDDE
jgi:flagellar biogenesis protein FliO